MSTISRRARAPLAPRAARAGRRPINSKGGGFASLARDLALGLADLLYLWQRRLRDRAALLTMTTAKLQDIGLSRAAALDAGEKTFWRRRGRGDVNEAQHH